MDYYRIDTPSKDGYDTDSTDFVGYLGFAFIGIILALIVSFVWEYRIRKNKKK
jgi:hypothetical protein